MLKITMTVGTKETEAMLEGLISGVQDFTPVWPQVERIVMDMERDQFESEGEFGGEEWAPLNEDYAAWKRRTYGSKGILVASGVLKTSLTTKGGLGHFYNAGPSFVEVGTTIPYGSFHQRGNANLPKRTVVPVPPKPVGEKVADAIMAFLIRAARRRVEGAR